MVDLFEERSMRMAADGEVIVVRWCDKPTVACIERATELQMSAIARAPGGRVSTLVIIDGKTVGFWSNEVRKRAQELSGELDKHVDYIAYVVEGSGFVSATIRSVIAGLHMLSRGGPKTKVFEDHGDAATWLHETLPSRPDLETLREMCRGVSPAQAA